ATSSCACSNTTPGTPGRCRRRWPRTADPASTSGSGSSMRAAGTPGGGDAKGRWSAPEVGEHLVELQPPAPDRRLGDAAVEEDPHDLLAVGALLAQQGPETLVTPHRRGRPLRGDAQRPQVEGEVLRGGDDGRVVLSAHDLVG